jgi:hypothetical protein
MKRSSDCRPFLIAAAHNASRHFWKFTVFPAFSRNLECSINHQIVGGESKSQIISRHASSMPMPNRWFHVGALFEPLLVNQVDCDASMKKPFCLSSGTKNVHQILPLKCSSFIYSIPLSCLLHNIAKLIRPSWTPNYR